MRSFMVDNQRFSELDELLILFIEPMARNVKEIMGTAPKYQNRDLNSMFQFISEQQKSQQKSSYGFILVPEKPGRFFFVYQHVGAPKPKHEYIVIRPDGFLFRDRTFSRIEDLIGGWKQMESQKMQQQRQMQKASSHQQQQGGPQMHPSRQNMLNGSGGRGGPPMHSQHHHDRRR